MKFKIIVFAANVSLELLSCTDQKAKKLPEPVPYTVITINDDTLEISSIFSFAPGDNAHVWVWVSKTLKGVCGFILRPNNDKETLPLSNDQINYYVTDCKVIQNRPKPSVLRLPTIEKLSNKKSPCEKYLKP